MNENKIFCDVSYGKANFSNQCVSSSTFVLSPPFIRSLAAKKLDRVGITSVHPCGPVVAADGAFYTDTLVIPENTVLLVQGALTRNGKGWANGSIFMRVRRGAAVVSILAKLPEVARNRIGSEVSVFTGQADILGVREVVDAGFEIPKGYISTFVQEDEILEIYRVVELVRQTTAPPAFEKAVAANGEVVTLQADNRVRRMRVRR